MPLMRFQLPGGFPVTVSDTPTGGEVLTFNAVTNQWDSETSAGGANQEVPSSFGDAGAIWTNMPAALTEFLGQTNRRISLDLSIYTQWSLQAGVGVVGFAGSILGLQGSRDGGTTWSSLDDDVVNAMSTATIAIDVLGLRTTAFVSIHSNFRISGVIVRIVGSGGNATADPAFAGSKVYFR